LHRLQLARQWLDPHDGLHREAQCAGLDIDCEAPDDAPVLQPAQALRRARRRQPDLLGQRLDRHSRVLLQQCQDATVDVIEGHKEFPVLALETTEI